MKTTELWKEMLRQSFEPRQWFDEKDWPEEETENAYNSVPFKPAFTARVKYRYFGRLKPMPYPPDE